MRLLCHCCFRSRLGGGEHTQVLDNLKAFVVGMDRRIETVHRKVTFQAAQCEQRLVACESQLRLFRRKFARLRALVVGRPPPLFTRHSSP